MVRSDDLLSKVVMHPVAVFDNRFKEKLDAHMLRVIWTAR
jgi:hypothetical protein